MTTSDAERPAPEGRPQHNAKTPYLNHSARRGTCPAFLALVVRACDFVILAVLAALAVAAVAEVVGWLP